MTDNPYRFVKTFTDKEAGSMPYLVKSMHKAFKASKPFPYPFVIREAQIKHPEYFIQQQI
jgi:hypothetical protein